MPKAMEQGLRASARKKGFTGKRFRAYVYGGMRARGWKPSREKK